jgi:hypothetical protein
VSLFCSRTQSMICVEHCAFIQGVRCNCVSLFMLAVLMQTAVLLLVGIEERYFVHCCVYYSNYRSGSKLILEVVISDIMIR